MFWSSKITEQMSNVIEIVIYANAHDVLFLSSFQKNIHRYQKTTTKNEN